MSDIARVVRDQAIVRTGDVPDLNADPWTDVQDLTWQCATPPPGLSLLGLMPGAPAHEDTLVRRLRDAGIAADHNYVLAQMTHSRFQPISYYRPHPPLEFGEETPGPVHVVIIDTPVLATSPVAGKVRPSSSTIPWKNGSAPVDPLVFHGGFAAGVVLREEPRADVEVVAVATADKFYSDWELACQLMAIEQRADADRPDIISLSLGGSPLIAEQPLATKKALEEIAKLPEKITVFAAAGNDGEKRVTYPAGLGDVYGVGGRPLGMRRRADFSNFGSEYVDLWGPAVDVVGPVVAGAIAFAEPDENSDDHHAHHVADIPPSSRERQVFTGWARADGTSWAAPFMAAKMATKLLAGKPADDAINELLVEYGGTS